MFEEKDGYGIMKISELKAQIAKSDKIDGALIVSYENRRYFTEFPSSSGFVLVSANRAVFITDSRYFEAAEKKSKADKTVLQTKIDEQIKEFFSAENVKTVGIEASRLTVQELSHYENALNGVCGVDFSDELDVIVKSLRDVKTESELEKITRAQRIAEEGLDHILGFIAPGKTEKEIQLELDFYMLSHGAEALSFETICAGGANSSVPHAVPSEKKIEYGEFIVIDFGALYEGYHSDMTRTVAVGACSDEMKTVYNTVLKAQNAGIAAVKPGMTGKEIDKISRDIIAEAGYGKYFGHSLGHGVGVEIHETPVLAPSAENVLEKGNVVTVEPGIYIPGKFGVRIEDFVYITEDGCVNITKANKELTII